MKHIIYRITNTANGRYYIGAHSTDDVNDSYMGSGELLKKAIAKYGLHRFIKEVLFEAASKEEMYEKEKELVLTVHDDPLSYNMNGGGKGGWDHVNKDPERVNAMHLPGVANKVSATLRLKYARDSKYRKTVNASQIAATRQAIITNTGKKRPEHSTHMKLMHLNGRLGHPTKVGSVFIVTDASGRNFEVSDLKQFCYDNDVPYVSLWNTSRTGIPLKKGKGKGWVCKLIKKGHYEYIKP